MALIGTKVRFLWPDGCVSDAAGEIVHVSPCKAYPQWWPLGDRCGYLPQVVSADAWRASWAGHCQPFLRAGGDSEDVAPRELQQRQFAADREPPVIGCEVQWDAVIRDGALVPLPGCQVRRNWVADARWLTLLDGTPLEVPPLIEAVAVAGDVL
jgi:hypothetical protein